MEKTTMERIDNVQIHAQGSTYSVDYHAHDAHNKMEMLRNREIKSPVTLENVDRRIDDVKEINDQLNEAEKRIVQARKYLNELESAYVELKESNEGKN